MEKRKHIWAMLLLIATWLFSTNAFAEKVQIDGIYYNLNGDEAEITYGGWSPYSGKFIIPSSVTYEGKTYSVTAIGEFAFSECFGLTSVIIPNTVTSINGMAFRECSSLESINIPSSVNSIQSTSFRWCSALKFINVDIENITYDSRNDCNAIIETASNTLIVGCMNTTIPNNVTSIGEGAFFGCSYLTSFNLPESVTSIGDNAFEECENLTTITIHKNIKRIGDCAFRECLGLTSIKVDAGNTIYDSRDNCNAIIETNRNTLIAGCKKTLIPNSVTSIKDNAFYGCVGLTAITIPNSVTSIGHHAFYKCSDLTTISLPNNVTSIGHSAFYKCFNLTSLIIPNGITRIESNTFYGCSGLKSITIPKSVQFIQVYAFANCSGLRSVNIPNSVTSIGNSAFSNCNSLTDVYCLAENVPNTDSYVFEATPLNSVTLHVPTNSIEAYSTTEPWSNFGTIVAIEEVKVEQTIEISALPEMTEGDAAYALPQQTDQGLTLTWTAADETIARISDYQLTPLKAGITTITATQEGNDEYQSFTKTFSLTVNEKEEVPSIEDTDISQMDNVIYIEPTEVKSDSETTLSFMMKNTANIRGFQFDLFLPEGITVVKSSKGKILGELNPERLPEEDEHQLTFSEQTNGAIRFLCSSLYDETFTGTSGVILTLQIKIDENMEDGEYPVQLKNMILNETDISKFYQTEFLQSKITVTSYMLGDINDDGEINVLDYTGVANHIHGNTPEGFVTKAADVDSNSVIDVRDYTGVANIIHTGFVSGSMGTSLNAKEYNNVEPQ